MTQQELWNGKFSREGYLYGTKPNAFIEASFRNFSINERVLCAGEGEGRNAIFLAKKGFEVAAIDASDVGLSKLETLAEEQGVKVDTRCVDLMEWEPSKEYGGVIATYLHLPGEQKKAVFEKLEKNVRHNGFIIIEVFSKNQLNYSSGGPKDEDLLYSIEDFKEGFQHSLIHKLEEVEIELDEGKGHQGKASVIRFIAQRN